MGKICDRKIIVSAIITLPNGTIYRFENPPIPPFYHQPRIWDIKGDYSVTIWNNDSIKMTAEEFRFITPNNPSPPPPSDISYLGLFSDKQVLTITKIEEFSGNCRCTPDSCRVDCATAPDGFCCIPHALTNQLLALMKAPVTQL